MSWDTSWIKVLPVPRPAPTSDLFCGRPHVEDGQPIPCLLLAGHPGGVHVGAVAAGNASRQVVWRDDDYDPDVAP